MTQTVVEAPVEQRTPALTLKSGVVALAMVLLWTLGGCMIAVNGHVFAQQLLMIVGFGAILTILLLRFPRLFLATIVLVYAGTWVLLYNAATPEDYPRLAVGLKASAPFAAAAAALAAWLCFKPLRRGELALIYACVVIAIPWCIAIKAVMESSTASLFELQRRAEPQMYEWAKEMPWWGPTIATGAGNEPAAEAVSAVRGFTTGNGGNVPWGIWLRPIAYWIGMCLAYEAMLMGLLLMFRRRWIEHERLPFAWTYPAMHVLGPDDSYRMPRRQWILFAIGLGICLPGIMLVGPSGEAMFGWTVPPWAGTAEGIRGGFDLTALNILPNVPLRLFWGPLVLAIFLLFPLDMLMTVAITFILMKLVVPQTMASLGFNVMGPVRWEDFIRFGLRGGGSLGILFWSIWYLLWDYIQARRARRRSGTLGGDGGKFPLWAAAISLFGLVAFIAMGCYASNLLQMLLLTGLLLIYAFTQVRQRIEGMPYTGENNLASHQLTSIQVKVINDHYTLHDEGVPITPTSWTTHWMQWAFSGQLKMFGPHNMLLEAFKIGHEVKVHARTIGLAILVTMLIVAALTPAVYLKTMYTYGFENSYQGELSTWGSFTQWSERSASYGLRSTGELYIISTNEWYDHWRNIINGGLGFLLIGGLFYLRREYPRFLINPIGVVLASEFWNEGGPFSAEMVWFSFLIAGVFKALFFRWVGVRSFREKIQPAVVMLLCGMIYGMMLFLFRHLSVGSGFVK